MRRNNNLSSSATSAVVFSTDDDDSNVSGARESDRRPQAKPVKLEIQLSTFTKPQTCKGKFKIWTFKSEFWAKISKM